jgi:hypothetical protein
MAVAAPPPTPSSGCNWNSGGEEKTQAALPNESAVSELVDRRSCTASAAAATWKIKKNGCLGKGFHDFTESIRYSLFYGSRTLLCTSKTIENNLSPSADSAVLLWQVRTLVKVVGKMLRESLTDSLTKTGC